MLMKKAMIAAAVVAAVVMGMIVFLGQANEMVYSIGILLMTASLTDCRQTSTAAEIYLCQLHFYGTKSPVTPFGHGITCIGGKLEARLENLARGAFFL